MALDESINLLWIPSHKGMHWPKVYLRDTQNLTQIFLTEFAKTGLSLNKLRKWTNVAWCTNAMGIC